MNSDAVSHDRNKLARWHRSLSAAAAPTASRRSGRRFPVYAVFLVSAEDQASHAIFREFRTSFESRAARFEHLVIFGQHGVSSTMLGLLSLFNLPPEVTPTLVLFADPAAVIVYTVPIPAGSGADDGSWRKVLAPVEAAADQCSGPLRLAFLPGGTAHMLNGGTVLQEVGSLLDRLQIEQVMIVPLG